MTKNEDETTKEGQNQNGELNSTALIIELMERNFERFPMLEVIFDKFARTFTSSMRNLTSDGISVNIEEIVSKRFKDYEYDSSQTRLMCIFGAKELDGRGVISIDRTFLNMMLTILFGGRKVPYASLSTKTTIFSTVDKKVADYIIQNILTSVKKSFELIAQINFFIDRYETNFKFIGITTPSEVIVCTSIKVELEKKSSILEIIFPRSMLSPIHKQLKSISTTDSSVEVSKWTDHFRSEVERVTVDLEFVLGKTIMSVNDLRKQSVGSIIVLDGQGQTENIVIKINGEPFFIGEAGKINNHVAVKIKEVLK